jgi:hypothetical protein
VVGKLRQLNTGLTAERLVEILCGRQDVFEFHEEARFIP